MGARAPSFSRNYLPKDSDLFLRLAMQIDLTWTTQLNSLSYPFFIGALAIWIIGIVLLSRTLPIGMSSVVVGAKILISAVYFSLLADGSWYVGADDAQYFEAGLALVGSGFNLLNIWATPIGQYLLLERESVGLIHYWNMIWLTVLETEYYAPVFGNILLSILAGLCWFKILRLFGFSLLFSQGALIFFLLHWTTITWTSFLDLKEPLVMAGASLFCLCLFGLLQRRWIMFIPGIACFAVFAYLRFYIPILITLGVLGGNILLTDRPIRWLALLIIIGTGLYLYFSGPINMVVSELFVFDVPTVVRGAAKQILSPLPWQITPESTYQLLGSILHLLMLPVALFGILLSIRSRSHLTMLLGVALVVYSVLALTPNLSTPRHRIVGDMMWIFFEYYGLFYLIKINRSLNIPVHHKAIQQ